MLGVCRRNRAGLSVRVADFEATQSREDYFMTADLFLGPSRPARFGLRRCPELRGEGG